VIVVDLEDAQAEEPHGYGCDSASHRSHSSLKPDAHDNSSVFRATASRAGGVSTQRLDSSAAPSPLGERYRQQSDPRATPRDRHTIVRMTHRAILRHRPRLRLVEWLALGHGGMRPQRRAPR
jgi:hypothetical protein